MVLIDVWKNTHAIMQIETLKLHPHVLVVLLHLCISHTSIRTMVYIHIYIYYNYILYILYVSVFFLAIFLINHRFFNKCIVFLL